MITHALTIWPVCHRFVSEKVIVLMPVFGSTSVAMLKG